MIPNLDLEKIAFSTERHGDIEIFFFFALCQAKDCHYCGRAGRERVVVLVQILRKKKEVNQTSGFGKALKKLIEKEFLHGIGLCPKNKIGHNSCWKKYMRELNWSNLW